MKDLKMDIKAVNKRASKRERNEAQEFGEFMPGYMNQPDLFNHAVEDVPEPTKSSIKKNIAWLVGLLIIQIAFFWMLIQYSMELAG